MADAPLTFGIDEALKLTGLSPTAFEKYQTAGLIIPLFKGTYTERLLRIAIERIENEALEKAKMKHEKTEPKARRTTRKESEAPSDGSTQERLRLLSGGT